MSSHLGGDVLDMLGTTILISLGADASVVRKKEKRLKLVTFDQW